MPGEGWGEGSAELTLDNIFIDPFAEPSPTSPGLPGEEQEGEEQEGVRNPRMDVAKGADHGKHTAAAAAADSSAGAVVRDSGGGGAAAGGAAGAGDCGAGVGAGRVGADD